ncbi:hypothetical protein [Streptomyces sp. NPDC005485]|uniref:hypothetical protein n=1 Tax=Streptomyces sp. NPDC005485 TaxID=3155591 RepID=UPI0033BE5283
MGWGEGAREPASIRPAWLNWPKAELNTAVAVCAAQLPAAVALWWLTTLGDDDYAVGATGALAAAGLLCTLVLGPPVAAVLGLVHAVVCTMPATTLAGLAARRLRGPEWLWQLAGVGVLGAVWGAITAVLGGWSFPVTAGLFVAFGVLPALGVRHVRRWQRTMGRAPRGGWAWLLWPVLASFALAMLVLGGGLVATVSGLIVEYEPPKLSAAQLSGVWRGEDGAVLHLHRDGRADLTGVPYTASGEDGPDARSCGGSGSWTRDHDEFYGRAGVLLSVDRCGDEAWAIGGTENDPELFVLIGDPDSGDVRILKRD